jgi:glycosyltransferase involved in cell wall biosynthesis
MRVLVTVEQRFVSTRGGDVWTQTGFSYPFWQRYLGVFDEVLVLARVQEVSFKPKGSIPASGVGVGFIPVPYYQGPFEYWQKQREVYRVVRGAVKRCDAVIMRVASQLANCLFPVLRREGRPYGLEVVGDPWDVFAPGTIRHPLRPLFRAYFSTQLRRQCHRASGVAYVTRHTLQRRYPGAFGAYSTSYSSVELPDGAFRGPGASVHPRGSVRDGCGDRHALGRKFRAILVGSLEQLYKGPDVLIEAVSQCSRSDLDVELTIVGDGRFRTALEQQAAQLGVSERVVFRGQIAAGSPVRKELDQADLFVLPSRTEGLPRAMIEAMARGLPCIGSTAGGIPELLPSEDLVRPGDAGMLAGKIREVLLDPEWRERMSARNLLRARDYRHDTLQARRIEFYQDLRDKTQCWRRRSRAA